MIRSGHDQVQPRCLRLSRNGEDPLDQPTAPALSLVRRQDIDVQMAGIVIDQVGRFGVQQRPLRVVHDLLQRVGQVRVPVRWFIGAGLSVALPNQVRDVQVLVSLDIIIGVHGCKEVPDRATMVVVQDQTRLGP